MRCTEPIDRDPVGRPRRRVERHLRLENAVEVVAGRDRGQRAEGAAREHVQRGVERRIASVESGRAVLGRRPRVPDARVGRAAGDVRFARLPGRIGVAAEHRSIGTGDSGAGEVVVRGTADEAVDEGSQRALVDLAVDSGLVGLCAAAAPARVADQPGLPTGDEQRSPAVALTGVHSTRKRAGAEHHGAVEAGAVLGRVRHRGVGLDRQVDLPQVVGRDPALGRVPMADRPHRVARVDRIDRFRHARPSLGRGGIETKHRNVVVEGRRVPTRVQVNRGDRPDVAGRLVVELVGADHKLQARRGHAAVDAVRGREHPDGGDERSTTECEVVGGALDRDEKGIGAGRSDRAADDAVPR